MLKGRGGEADVNSPRKAYLSHVNLVIASLEVRGLDLLDKISEKKGGHCKVVKGLSVMGVREKGQKR